MDMCANCSKNNGGYCHGCINDPKFDDVLKALKADNENSNVSQFKKQEYIKLKDLQNLLQNIEMKLKNERLNDEEQVIKWIEKSKTIMDIRDKINNLEKFYF